jgi:hypothetical protein
MNDVAAEPGVAKPQPAIAVKGLNRNFGGIVAFDF